MTSFFVGYQPRLPRDIATVVRRTVFALGAIAGVVAFTLVLAQSAFPPATFDFTQVRGFEGTLEEFPYPALLVKRPGDAGYSRYVLVGEGKHGAADQARGKGGQQVRLRGKLVYRDDETLIEVASGSIERLGSGPGLPAFEDLGVATLTGEIVDSKCYTGVMNPGRGKVHRDCAARCISGGIPPALVVNDAEGASVYLLAGADGKPLGSEILDRVGEPVKVTGEILKSGDTLYLRAASDDILRAAD